MGLVGSVGFGLRLPLRDPELMSFYRRRYISSTSRVLIGFRASDAFVWYLIEDGLVFVGFFLVGFGLCLLLLEEAGLGADELNGTLTHVFCVQQFSFGVLIGFRESGALPDFRGF